MMLEISELFELEVSPVAGQSLQLKVEKGKAKKKNSKNRKS